MKNKQKRWLDWLIVIVGIMVFISVFRGTWREYQNYRRGVNEIRVAKEKLAELEGRKARLEKLVDKMSQPGVAEEEALRKLGYIKEGEVVVVPTVIPVTLDLKLPKPTERTTYWQEWRELFF